MCNFVPGECIAIGYLNDMQQMLQEWTIPGRIEYLPLVAEDPELDDMLFQCFGITHVTDIPDGLEVLVVSKLSAALRDAIACHEAVVELNYYLPFSNNLQERTIKSLSPPASELADRLREITSRIPMPPILRPLGIIDSGINLSQIQTTRNGGPSYDNQPGAAYDYSSPRRVQRIAFDQDHDNLGHGTNVFFLLDRALRNDVPIVSGKISNQEQRVTVLNLARAYMHLVSKERPAVVNLSLAPRNDTFRCEYCGQESGMLAFHTLILPYVFRLAAPYTLTVLAAGNRGQPCNARHFLGEAEYLYFAIALNSKGNVAQYSNYVDRSACLSLSAFGGDSDEITDGYGVFNEDRNSRGTSLAAPFISTAAYAAKLAQIRGDISSTQEAVVAYCREIMPTPNL